MNIFTGIEYEIPLPSTRTCRHWQDRYYWPIVVTGLLLPFVLGVWHGGWQGGISGFLLGGLFRLFMVLNSTFTINSLCHMVGAQPYSTKDSSRDSWLISFVSFGEGYHNFHHSYARDFRNGPKWCHSILRNGSFIPYRCSDSRTIFDATTQP